MEKLQKRSPRKILFLLSALEGGGAERVASLLCSHWAAIGHQVVLVATFSQGGSRQYDLDNRVRVEYLADRVRPQVYRSFNRVMRLYAIRRLMKEVEPDVVISFLTPVNVAALLASVGLNLPVVVSERNYPPHMKLGYPWSLLRYISYPRARLVVAQTKGIADWLEQHCRPRQTTVVPNPLVYPLSGSGSALDPRRWIRPGRQLVLAAGRMVEQKGFDVLIEAFAPLAAKYPAWDMVILGDGGLRAGLTEMCNALGLQDRIHMPGWAGNMDEWYSQADMYVLSSRFEGFPNTLLEAMAYGLPVVSFDCPTGPGDIIRHGIDGMLVSAEQGSGGLEQAIATLLSDDALRESLGHEATKVRSRFSIESVTERWDEILNLEGQ